jgi:hypothetical protein
MTLSKASILAIGVALVLPVEAADALSDSNWPERDLARFVFERLDLSSFGNSTGPRRRPGQRFFRELGIHPNAVSDTEAASNDDEWSYSVQILGKADYNKDGVVDVLVCFHDMAQNGGSYFTRNPYVLQLIDGRAIALPFADDSRAEAARCRSARSRADAA